MRAASHTHLEVPRPRVQGRPGKTWSVEDKGPRPGVGSPETGPGPASLTNEPAEMNPAGYFTCPGRPSTRPLGSQLSKPGGVGNLERRRPSLRLPRAAPAPRSPSPCAHRAALRGARCRLRRGRLDGPGPGRSGGRGHGARQLRPRPLPCGVIAGPAPRAPRGGRPRGRPRGRGAARGGKPQSAVSLPQRRNAWSPNSRGPGAGERPGSPSGPLSAGKVPEREGGPAAAGAQHALLNLAVKVTRSIYLGNKAIKRTCFD